MNVCTPSGLASLGTSLGLSQTTGYTPYLPVLALSIATKWFHLCQLNPAFGFITSDWFLILAAVLTAVDLIVDLIPAVSTGWHAVHTAITPFIGGFVAAATTSGFSLPGGISTLSLPADASLATASLAGTTATVLMFIVGFVLAGLVHVHRFGGRTVANVGHVFTLGISNIVISVLEDILAIISIILSFLAPVLMLVIVVIVVLVILLTFRYIRRGWRFLRGWPRDRRSAA
jgi:uncharacterized protein DUF4126